MVRTCTFNPILVGVPCGKFRVLQCLRVLEISETPAGGRSVRLTPIWIPGSLTSRFFQNLFAHDTL
jgi:hypothetical protein